MPLCLQSGRKSGIARHAFANASDRSRASQCFASLVGVHGKEQCEFHRAEGNSSPVFFVHLGLWSGLVHQTVLGSHVKCASSGIPAIFFWAPAARNVTCTFGSILQLQRLTCLVSLVAKGLGSGCTTLVWPSNLSGRCSCSAAPQNQGYRCFSNAWPPFQL